VIAETNNSKRQFYNRPLNF